MLFRGKRIDRMNNNGWQQARHDAGLPLVRVHDLRLSFGARLRAAGVSAEDREALLGHAHPFNGWSLLQVPMWVASWHRRT
jgi:integrase